MKMHLCRWPFMFFLKVLVFMLVVGIILEKNVYNTHPQFLSLASAGSLSDSRERNSISRPEVLLMNGNYHQKTHGHSRHLTSIAEHGGNRDILLSASSAIPNWSMTLTSESLILLGINIHSILRYWFVTFLLQQC